MSYSRWSNSAWYSFSNGNGQFSLWYSLDRTINWEYDDLVVLMLQSPSTIVAKLVGIYGCTELEATEAIGYIRLFLIDEGGVYV